MTLPLPPTTQVGTLGKLSVILVVWLALIVLTTFYCYFCEQRLFPKQRLLDWTNSNSAAAGRKLLGRGLFFRHRREGWAGSGSSWSSW